MAKTGAALRDYIANLRYELDAQARRVLGEQEVELLYADEKWKALIAPLYERNSTCAADEEEADDVYFNAAEYLVRRHAELAARAMRDAGVDVPAALADPEAAVHDVARKLNRMSEPTVAPMLPMDEDAFVYRPPVNTVKETDERNALILTCGLPRAGKTTWARRQGYPIVCPDAIRLALHGQPYVRSAERVVWATAHLMVEALFRAGHSRVILDATNLRRKYREEWQDERWAVYCKLFTTPVEECMVRAARAPGYKQVVRVIEKMSLTAEWLSEEELVWTEDESDEKQAKAAG